MLHVVVRKGIKDFTMNPLRPHARSGLLDRCPWEWTSCQRPSRRTKTRVQRRC